MDVQDEGIPLEFSGRWSIVKFNYDCLNISLGIKCQVIFFWRLEEFPICTFGNLSRTILNLEVINSNLIAGYKDCIIIYNLKSGSTLDTLKGFTKFQKNSDQIFLYSYEKEDGNAIIRNMDNAICFECNYPVNEFIYWNSRIITSNSLIEILGSEISFLRSSSANDKIIAIVGNSLCLLST